MSRHGFRSQPALQRSRETPSLSLLGLGGLIALGLGFGALLTTLQERPAPGVQTYGASGLAPAAAGSAPAATASAPSPSPAAPPPQSAPAPAAAPPAVRPPARAHPPRAARTPHAKPAAAAPSPQQAWEQQRAAYERALAAYDANEKAEGYRWAQENRIRLDRYCRAAERRTPAFLQGCLGYVRGEPAKGGRAE